MRVDIPFEILFAIGILIFTLSLYVYGLIIKRLLPLIQKRGICIEGHCGCQPKRRLRENDNKY